MLNIAVNK